MREKIIEIIDDVMIEDIDIASCDNLIDGGYLDSMDVVSIVMDLNDEFDVEISVENLQPENFNSVDAIVQLIQELS